MRPYTSAFRQSADQIQFSSFFDFYHSKKPCPVYSAFNYLEASDVGASTEASVEVVSTETLDTSTEASVEASTEAAVDSAFEEVASTEASVEVAVDDEEAADEELVLEEGAE